MPRIRSIKPEFFQDEDLAALDPLDRLVFIGIWTQADKAGLLEDRPSRLKVQILPYDSADMAGIISRLVEKRFLIRYSSQDKSYLAVRTFEKHQRPHHTEQKSELPAPTPLDNGATPVSEPLSNRVYTVRQRLEEEEGKEEGKEKESIKATSPRPGEVAKVDSTSPPAGGSCYENTNKPIAKGEAGLAAMVALKGEVLEVWRKAATWVREAHPDGRKWTLHRSFPPNAEKGLKSRIDAAGSAEEFMTQFKSVMRCLIRRAWWTSSTEGDFVPALKNALTGDNWNERVDQGATMAADDKAEEEREDEEQLKVDRIAIEDCRRAGNSIDEARSRYPSRLACVDEVYGITHSNGVAQ